MLPDYLIQGFVVLLRNLNAQLLLEPELYSIFDVSFREPVGRVLLKTPLRFYLQPVFDHTRVRPSKRTQLGGINSTIGVHESGKVPVPKRRHLLDFFVHLFNFSDVTVVVDMATSVARFGIPTRFILRLNDKIEPPGRDGSDRVPYDPWRSPVTTNTDLVGGPIEVIVVKVERLGLAIIEILLHIPLDRGKIILVEDLIPLQVDSPVTGALEHPGHFLLAIYESTVFHFLVPDRLHYPNLGVPDRTNSVEVSSCP